MKFGKIIIFNVAFISILLFNILLAVTVGRTATVDLQFNSLPTAQGWSYFGVPEPTVASVDGTMLTINTIGKGSVSAWYEIPNLVEPDLPFTMSVKARLVADTPDTEEFSFQARHGLELWSMTLYINTVVTPGSSSLPIDGTIFHDFVIEGIPGVRV